MEIKPFTAVLPTEAGLHKLTTNDHQWTSADERVQPSAGYYWYELTHNGIHQWRLIASWPEQLSVTTMLPGGINTVLYPKQPVIEMLIDDWVGHFPKTCEFTDAQGVTHRLWQVTEAEVNADITETMAPVAPRKTWLTTTSTPLVMLVADSEWTKFKTQPQVPEHLIQQLTNQ
ncbi:hypothetical protein D1831_04015 [Lactiplantibacillus garii]|uniref:Uncharacterized protein n=1 Tax=Lactiplantibacillus garii TaxID=2306423 RepID=A0A3R8J884_9LACO|nr:DUF1015 family protein [Lactiplantibacillus garii]RRK11119.1 hypothetical protein D1831_04015 [Lactiplantibacillus garii]